MDKRCPSCATTKPASEFGKNKAKPDGLQAYCKACVKIINAEYYRKTPERNAQRTQSRDKGRDAAREFVMAHMLANPCVDCGESDPVVLEFDHVRGDKLGNLSDMISQGVGVLRISAEIEKCEVRCANCHRRVTAKRGGHWRIAI